MFDLDITFCWGLLKTGDKTIVCPRRDECKRFWNEKYSEYAKKTGDMFHSFFLMEKPEDIEKCTNFLKKETAPAPDVQEDQPVNATLESVLPNEPFNGKMNLYLSCEVPGESQMARLTRFVKEKMEEYDKCAREEFDRHTEDWYEGGKNAFSVVLNFILNKL